MTTQQMTSGFLSEDERPTNLRHGLTWVGGTNIEQCPEEDLSRQSLAAAFRRMTQDQESFYSLLLEMEIFAFEPSDYKDS